MNTLSMQIFMVKMIRFSFQNQGILCSSLAITIRETSTVKDLSKLQIQKSLFKKPVVVSKANQRVT